MSSVDDIEWMVANQFTKLLISIVLVCVSKTSQFLNQCVWVCVRECLVESEANYVTNTRTHNLFSYVSGAFMKWIVFLFNRRPKAYFKIFEIRSYDCAVALWRTHKITNEQTKKLWSNEMTMAKYEHKKRLNIRVNAIKMFALSIRKCFAFAIGQCESVELIYRQKFNRGW